MLERYSSQNHIYQFLERKTRDTFPRALLLIGESGCGKHHVCDLIKNKLNLDMQDISENLNFDFLMQLYERPQPYIYIIEASKISVKEQNTILKFIEEPLKNSYIVILAENSNQLLLTILNRCQKLIFNPYSIDELRSLTNNELVLKIAKTPGQVTSLLANNLEDIVALSNKIIDKIGTANLPNVLTISDKLAFKGEKDKFDIECFSRTLNYLLVEKIKTDNNIKYQEMYKLVSDWNRERKAPTVVQNFLFERYLVKIHELMRN